MVDLSASIYISVSTKIILFDVLKDGYRGHTMSRWMKRGLMSFILMPKLALDLGMLHVGSHYAGAAKRDESTINSVVG